MGKAGIRKKIPGFNRQISIHMEKLSKASAGGNQLGMDYWSKEISNFETQRRKWLSRRKPKG